MRELKTFSMMFMNTDIKHENEYILSQIKNLEKQNSDLKNQNSQL
jgi:hypothetical protein